MRMQPWPATAASNAEPIRRAVATAPYGRPPSSQLALAAALVVIAGAALAIDLSRACVACGRSGGVGIAIAALGAASYACLVALGRRGRGRAFAEGAAAALAIHVVLVVAMARDAAWCAPCVVAAATCGVLAASVWRTERSSRRRLGAVFAVTLAAASALLAVAVGIEAHRAATTADGLRALAARAERSSPAGAPLPITVYERAGCAHCAAFRAGDLARLERDYGDALAVSFAPAERAPGVTITPTVVVGEATVFQGAPTYDELRHAVSAAIAGARGGDSPAASPLAPILAVAPPEAAPAAAPLATYYISASGSDAYTAAQARSKATPWAHLPGMPTCGGNCATYQPRPGDAFVLKGGDAWHAQDLGVDWRWSGTSAARILIGTDHAWFSGAAWRRPILTCDGAPCAGPTRQQMWIDGAYVTVDDLEFTGLQQRGGSVQDVAVFRDHDEVADCYFHGWSRAPGENDNGSSFAITANISDGEDQVAGASFHGNVIDGADTTRDMWGGIEFADQVYDNVIRYVVSGLLGNFTDVHRNLIEYDVYSYAGDHANLMFVFHPFDGATNVWAYDNVVRHNRLAPGSMAFWINGNWGCAGCVSYVYNNVVYDVDNGIVALGAHPSSGDTGTYYVYNNTIQANGGACMGNGEGPPRSITKAGNNHCIGVSSLCDGTGTTWTDLGGNVLQTAAQAAAAGYAATSTYAFAPAGGGSPTVGAARNLSALCSGQLGALCRDIAYSTYDAVNHTVVVRPTVARPAGGAWDAGAYEFAGATGDQPPSVAITAPADGAVASAPATIAIAASASDPDGAVARVEFYQGATLIGTSATAPYAFTWSGVGVGSYALTAKAYDDQGAATTSTAVTVTVTAANGALTMGEPRVLDADDDGNGGLLVAQQTTLARTATLTSLSFYVTNAAGRLRLGVYDATGAGGGPGRKRAETAEITPAVGWNTGAPSSTVSLAAGTYWLAYLASDDALGFRKELTGEASWVAYAYAALPAAFPASPSTGGVHWSLYATLAPDAGIVSGQWYELAAKHSGKLVDVAGVSKLDGANVQQWSDWDGPNQIWRIDAVGDGSYTLVSKNSGKALDVQGWSKADGGNVIQWALHGGANQRWTFTDVGGGFFKITNVNSGKVLDVGGISTADGANIQQWTWWGGDNQRWTLVPVVPGSTG